MMPPGLTTTATQDQSTRLVRKVKPKISLLDPLAASKSPALAAMKAMQRQAKPTRRKF